MDPQSALLSLAAERVATHPSPIAAGLARALAGAVARPLEDEPARVPLCRLLPALTASGAEPLLERVAACEGRLHWRSRGAARRPEALAARIASVELIGPSGMVRHATLRAGLLLQDARLDYPWHRHAAEELYLVLHGEATWTAGTDPPRVVPAGEFVHHRPWQPHRMTTGEDALLALWGWAGDIDYARYELLDGPADAQAGAVTAPG